MQRIDTVSSLKSLISEQSKHFLTKFASYMVKAISLLYNFDCKDTERSLELVQPLEALTKMTKALQVIEDSN